MAIRRCPYCKAIIDESQKYCNNCGTQLLFPDDEAAEEDLKGEKVIDEDSAAGPEDELEASLEPPAEDAAEAGPEEIDLEDVLQAGGAFPGDKPAESKPGGDEEVGEIEANEEASAAESVALGEGIIKSAEELLGKVAEPDLDLREKEESEDEAEEDKSAANGLDFDAKGEIVQLMAELEKRKAAQIAESGGSDRSETGPEDLPPWAELVKEGVPIAPAAAGSGETEDNRGEAGEDALGSKGFAPGDTMDFRNDVMRRADLAKPPSSTMGFPESVTKVKEDLPFRDEPAPSRGREPAHRFEDAAIEDQPLGLGDEGLEALEAEAEGEGEAGERPEEPARPSLAEDEKIGFIGSVKAFLFDAAFVAVLWLIAVGLAAGLMKVGLLSLVRAASLSFGLLFLALFTGYFFLFLFFLGETLGRRLAAPKD